MPTPGRSSDGLSVAVLGPGAVGGFLAALLWRQGHAVTCVAREPAASTIAGNGLRLESATLGDFVARPRAVASLDVPVSVLFVATKATSPLSLAEASRRADPELVAGPSALVVPLLNGVEHMSTLRGRYGRRVVAGSIGALEAYRRAPGHVVHASASARVELASDGDVPAERLAQLAGLLRAAGIPTEVLPGEASVLWRKLVRLCALACTTAASGQPLGAIRTDAAWRAHLEGCVREAAAVATAEGVSTAPETVLAQIDALPAGLTTSLARDVAAGRPSELDAIAGAVIRAGVRRALACPTIEDLYRRIQHAPTSAAPPAAD